VSTSYILPYEFADRVLLSGSGIWTNGVSAGA